MGPPDRPFWTTSHPRAIPIALLVQTCGDQTDLTNATNATPPTTEPERPPTPLTPPDTVPTPDSESRRSTARNATRMTRNATLNHPPLHLQSTPPGGSTAAWAWAPCSGRTTKARSGNSSLAAADTVPRPSAVARLLRKQHRPRRDHPPRPAPLAVRRRRC